MGDAHHECFTAIANPKTGYYFTHWDDGDTNNPRIIPATPNRTITAYFTKQTYTIMATSDISSHGNVTGTGSYEYLDECTLEAIANDGYHFSHWNDGDSNAIRTFTVTQDSTMVAFFEINNYQLIAAPNDASLGNVTGSGTFAHGTHVTVTATPTQGNRFDRWSNNSIWANYIFTITKDTQLVAVFVPVDTVHVHDTTYIDVHDTTYIDVFVHDTTTVTDTVTLTEYVPVHDTTIVNTRDTIYLPVFLHDTTFVDVHDTTIVVDTLTLTEYVPVHDTTYIDVLVYDTITVIDTVTLTEYVPVHDTTYIDVFVHDTTTVIDTVTLTEYVPVHDTTYIDVFVHDTTYVDVFVHDTTTVTVIDTVDNYIFDTTIVHDTTLVTDTLWLTHYDTIWLHDTITIHDTIMVGMDDVDALNAKVYINSGQIVVDGTDGNTVWLYDAVGRLLATRQDDYAPLRFDVPATGTYLIKVGHHPARRVVVVK